MSRPSDVSRRRFLLGAAAAAVASQLPAAAPLAEEFIGLDLATTELDRTAVYVIHSMSWGGGAHPILTVEMFDRNNGISLFQNYEWPALWDLETGDWVQIDGT